MKRRDFLELVVKGVICASIPLACSTNTAKIRIGLHTWVGYEPTELADEMGWLSDNIELIHTQSATESIDLLEKNQIDGAMLTLDEVFRVREKGILLSIILITDISSGADQFIVKLDIKNIEDIKGKTIALEEGAVGELMLSQILRVTQLKKSDVKLLKFSIDQHLNAWNNSEIDGVITYEPVATELIEKGGKCFFNSSQVPNLIVDVIVIRQNLLNSNYDDTLKNLVSSHLKGVNHIRISSDDASYRLSQKLNLPPELVMSTFKGLILPDLENNIRLIAQSNPELNASISLVSKTMIDAGMLKLPVSVANLVEPKYILSLQSEM
jgi:NitT/TauT family transport system substrate-binding protein